MPRANDFAVFYESLAKRAPHVETHIVDGRASSVDIGYADGLAGDLEFFGLAGRRKI
jgi:hypothetical protein